jgi:hypothetical protein
VNKCVDLSAVLASNDVRERRDSVRVREVARIAADGVSSAAQIRNALLDFFGGAIDQNERCSEFSERASNDFAHLSLGTNPGQNDG